MPTMTEIKSDAEIQQDVIRQLRWDTRMKETDVGVEVDRGIVTLTGTVDRYAKKLAAREAAHRVEGVLDVADDIEIQIPGIMLRSDTDIAKTVRLALEQDVFLPDARIRSTVSNGWVSLEGSVDSLADRDNAERAVLRLQGVRGVINNIIVKPRKAESRQDRKAIEKTLAYF